MVISYQACPFINAGQDSFGRSPGKRTRQAPLPIFHSLPGISLDIKKPLPYSLLKGASSYPLALGLQRQRTSGLLQDAGASLQPLYLHFAQGEFENPLHPAPAHYRRQAETYLTEPILPL